jgi:hypothetical protein
MFHLETIDLPFPQCLISDPWRDGHLDILLFHNIVVEGRNDFNNCIIMYGSLTICH